MTVEVKTVDLFKRLAKLVEPPPNITVTEWAEKNRVLSREASSEPGKYSADRAPYQRAIQDAMNDPEVTYVIIKSSAQVGKTELMNNGIGCTIDIDPSPMLVVMPTEALAKTWSKKRLSPMLRDTPCLQGKVGEARSRDGENTILEKSFRGGYIAMVGANSPVGLSSRPIKKVFADEIDRFPASAGDEGDPLSLAEKRTATFWDKKFIFVSTPTIKGISRIEKEYNESTMETWNLPCPMCDRLQPLDFEQIKFKKSGDEVKSPVMMECRFCREQFTKYEWTKGEGEYIAKHPERKSKRGFALNALASPWESWESIVVKFLSAKKKGKEALKTFVNTYLGETWEDEIGDTLNKDILYARREVYHTELPAGVLLLTAGVDVQDNRLEIEIVGWGKNKESWGIYYKQIYGDPKQPTVWNALDTFLSRKYKLPNGTEIPIMCTCVDSGYLPDYVYKFTRPREHKKVYAIKGKGSYDVPYIGGYSRKNRYEAVLFTLGVDNGKEIMFSNLKAQVPEDGQSYPPGFCHFPSDQVEGESRGYNQKYFEGLCSEKKLTKYKAGKAVFVWTKIVTRNEPWDLRNYASAALEILNPNFDAVEQSLNRLAGTEVTPVPVRKAKKKKKKSRMHSSGI